ncbi:hypothetical protein [Microcoleus sp.]|uniref:hypothetical protein n=1 Tax=Microcoleus sp. TaxID=44472 RepID=UPI003C741ED1
MTDVDHNCSSTFEGSWQLAVGGWLVAVGCWQLAVVSWQFSVGSWQLLDQIYKIALNIYPPPTPPYKGGESNFR